MRIQPQDPSMGDLFDWGKDHARIETQLERIRALMVDTEWRTINHISDVLESRHETKFPLPSVQADLRHLRKPEFGAYHVLRRRRADGGLYEYCVHETTCHCHDCLWELERRERRKHQRDEAA